MNGGHNSGSGFGINVQFNGDATASYGSTVMRGNGSVADSFRYTSQTALTLGIAGLNNLNNSTIIQIQNYSNGVTNKTVLSRNNGATETWAVVGLWRNTSPINSLRLFPETASWLSGTTFSIYGVAAGNSSAKASGGNIVTTDGSYWYHAFTSSGTFIPNETLTCDYLVVAGGGGGGWTANNLAGGGGAGGLRSTVTATGGLGTLESPLSLSANTIYTATIGGGGATSGAYLNGLNGFNSTFASITSTGGGNAALSSASVGASSNGNPGGSGGGATGNSGTGGVRTASPVQGFNGGNSTSNSIGGGGGGAGEAGNTNGSGAGGDGVQITALSTATGTGVSGFYGGGGGAAATTPGTGGAGGGGAGKASGLGNPGIANTGGGGGGTNGTLAGQGGSGIVIIRYAV